MKGKEERRNKKKKEVKGRGGDNLTICTQVYSI
jgi:hypothetical protein